MFVLNDNAPILECANEFIEVKTENEVDPILKYVSEYVFECLENRIWDAHLYCGINNSGKVIGVSLNENARIQLMKSAENIRLGLLAEQPAIPPTYSDVITCHRVFKNPKTMSPADELWIIEGKSPPAPKFAQNTKVSFREAPNTEFKEGQQYDQIEKFVVACLNTGIKGHIYLGIKDDREVKGVNLSEKEVDQVRNNIDQILGGITPQIEIPTEGAATFYPVFGDAMGESTVENLNIIEVTVPDADSSTRYFTSAGRTFDRQSSMSQEIPAQTIHEKREDREEIPPENQKENLKLDIERELDLAELEDFINPYSSDIEAESEMFKGRTNEITRLLAHIRNGSHTAIFGLQRMGKSSLVGETMKKYSKLQEDVLFVKVDLQEEGGQNATYGSLLRAIIKNIATKSTLYSEEEIEAEMDRKTQRYRKGDTQLMLSDFSGILHRLVTEVTKIYPKVVLFLDEFSELCRAIDNNEKLSRDNSIRSAHILPPEMHVDVSIMQWFSSLCKNKELKKKLVIIFAVRPFVAEYDKKKSLQLLKLTRAITLFHLDETAAKELMIEPLKKEIHYAEGCVDYLYNLTAGHPFLIQFLLEEIVDYNKYIKIECKRTIEMKDITKIEDMVISKDAEASYDGKFDVLDSDYSLDSVKEDSSYQKMGKGVLALIARKGNRPEQDNRWVQVDEVCDVLTGLGVAEDEFYTLLKQLLKAKIIEQRESSNSNLECRMSILLLHKRYIEQNMYKQYFRHNKGGILIKKF